MQIIQSNQPSYLIGTPIRTIYSNFQNPLAPYSIFEVEVQDTNIEIISRTISVVIQSSPPEKNNQSYKFFGTLENHHRYGPTFNCGTYIRNIPINSTHVIAFLSSGLFHGVKRKRAEQIVEKLGEDCLVQIINDPEILRQVKGISEKTINTIQEVILENLGMQDIITKLHEWNISLNLAKKIYKLYGDASVQKIVENPYCLANTVRGISFNRADEIANLVEIRGTDSRRIKGAIEHALHEIFEKEGSSYGTKGYVMQKADQILFDRDGVHYPSDLINENLTELISTNIEEMEDFTTAIGQVRQIENRIYFTKYYSYEQQIAETLSILLDKKIEPSDEQLNLLVGEYVDMKSQFPFKLSPEQDMAIVESMLNPVLVITGGPGTGKSTIIEAILRLHLHFFKKEKYKFLKKVILLAPTGRAAKRMNEITKLPAQTIHRFLMTRDIDEPVEKERLFIVDEMSMIDISLMNRLLLHLQAGDKIIIVGDKDQLPPIKAGNVFVDLIESNAFPTAELTTVFRQQHNSSINQLAASIRNDEFSEEVMKDTDNVKWLPAPKEDIVKTIRTEILSVLESNIPFKDIQVLAPIHNGEQGITFINIYLQELLITGEIPAAESLVSTGFSNGKYDFHIGDRVIQLKNNTDKDLMNGDIGIVTGVLPACEEIQYDELTETEKIIEEPKRLTIRFGDMAVTYYREEMDQLALAYCFSVHKAQGSEFPYVILPISNAYTLMVNRNLLYTAITRAKKEIRIIGDLAVFSKGIQKKPRQRYTFLKDLLIEGKDYILK